MFRRLLLLACAVLFGACQKSDIKVLIGGSTIVAPGAQPIEDSVIVVAGKTVRSVGLRKDIPIPQNSERTDLSGKWILPADEGRIAVGEPANLLVREHTADSPVIRRMVAGEWK